MPNNENQTVHPSELSELTNDNYEDYSLTQGTKILKEDLDILLRLNAEDLERLRKEGAELTEEDESQKGLYERLTNLTKEDFAPDEEHFMNDLFVAKEESKNQLHPEGRDVSKRLLDLENKKLGMSLLDEGNKKEKYEYDQNIGEIRRHTVTGDLEFVSEFFYRSDDLPPGQSLGAGIDNALTRQTITFKNDLGQLTVVEKKYSYQTMNNDENITEVVTTTTVDDVPPHVPVIAGSSVTEQGQLNISIAPRLSTDKNNFKHYLVYELLPDGKQKFVTSNMSPQISFFPEKGNRTFVIKAQDHSNNTSQGVIVGPILIKGVD